MGMDGTIGIHVDLETMLDDQLQKELAATLQADI